MRGSIINKRLLQQQHLLDKVGLSHYKYLLRYTGLSTIIYGWGGGMIGIRDKSQRDFKRREDR